MIEQYFNGLLIPLKETSAAFRALFTAIAREFDALYAYAGEECKGAFALFGDRASLGAFARERGAVPIRGEIEAGYAKRTVGAFAFLSSAHTKEGITALVRTFTAKPFTLRELWAENWILGKPSEILGLNTVLGSEHGSNTFLLEFARLTLAERDYLKELLELYKPAHSAYRIGAVIQEDWILGAEGKRLGYNTYI